MTDVGTMLGLLLYAVAWRIYAHYQFERYLHARLYPYEHDYWRRFND